ncbi:MAG: amino acid adenylation domain-containing protein [Acidobacteriota bacterium]
MADSKRTLANLSPEQRARLLELARRKRAQLSPLPRDGRGYPLSYGQSQLWFLSQLGPEASAAYNLPILLRLRGPLDAPALERALQTLVGRHEGMRTSFALEGELPVQRIAGSIQVSLVPESFAGDGEGTETLARLAEEESRRAFDLAAAPLFRARLLRSAADEHHLLLVFHHIIFDGWSMGILLRELAACYVAESGGPAASLEDLPVQYADYAAWQRRRLEDGGFTESLDHWVRRLDGAPPLLGLPHDRPRPATQTFAGARATFGLSAALAFGLGGIARACGATPFAVLMAGFRLALCRLSGERDLCVGTPMANRERLETEGVVGAFINTVVLRGEVDPGATFLELVQRTRDLARDAMAHQELPFERLVETLRPERGGGHNPLFQVMFILHEVVRTEGAFGDVGAEALDLGVPGAQFDLTLSLSPRDAGGFDGVVDYSTDLFDAATIDRFMAVLETLLTAAVAAPSVPVARLDGVPADDRLRVQGWNRTEAPVPKAETLHGWVARRAALHPDRVAVTFGDVDLTYGEVQARANRLAHHLRGLGAGPETRVGLLLDRGGDMVVALLGILGSGAAYVPLDPSYPRDRLIYMLEDSGASVVVSSGDLFADLGADVQAGGERGTGLRTVLLDADADVLATRPSHAPASAEPGRDALAYVLYTSGSTGRPKGVQIPHRAVLSFLASMARAPGLGSEDVLLSVTTLSFDIAGLEIFLPLTQGARLVVVDRGTAADGRLLGAALDACGATVMQATPATWQQLLASGWSGRSDLKALCGGEALPVDLARSLTERCGELWNVYGPTEATIWSTARRVGRGGESPRGQGVVSLGLPIANTTVHVVAEAGGGPVPIGGPGELWIGGVGLSRGYLGRPGMTAERFVPDPFGDAPGGRLYRTGDLVRRRPEGDLEFLGRLDHQVKVRGFRIELGEVEAALGRHPGVAQRAAAVQKDPAGAARLIGYVVATDPSRPPTVEELSSFLSEELPGYMVPAGFMVLESLPLTPNGKVDRKSLPEFDAEVAAEAERQEPRSDLERRLAALWCDVLGLESVSVDSNFFSLGGHSLMATRLLARVLEQEGVELPLGTIFQAPTVALMAAAIEARRGSEVSAPLPIPSAELVGRSFPLSSGQSQIWFLSQLGPEASTAHHLPVLLRLRGRLDGGALARALASMLERHGALRTSFHLEDGLPVQRIVEVSELPSAESMLVPEPLPTELHGATAEEREAWARRRMGEETGRPFDLTKAPLLRLRWIRGDGDGTEHYLLVIFHHLISDGWSLEVFLRELGLLYGADGGAADLDPSPGQYGDFAIWQKERLETGGFDDDKRYWRRQLDGAAPLLELPYDRPRPAEIRFSGGRRTFQLSPALATSLRSLARDSGSTLFSVVLAGLQLLLSRLSGQGDVSIGTAMANRERPGTGGALGVFINTVVLRSQVDPARSFHDLVRQTRTISTGAFSHQELPFEQVVELMKPERHAYNPLFQVMLLLHNQAEPGETFGDLGMEPLLLELERSQFDLSFAMGDEADGGLQALVDYSTELFDASTIDRFVVAFETLLVEAVAAPDVPVGRLDAVPQDDRRRVQGWNRTGAPPPAAETLHGWVARRAASHPDRVAVTCDDTDLTYGELQDRANRLAHHLRGLGAGPETRVGLLLDRGSDMVVALLGILGSGAAYVPLDSGFPPDRLAHMVEDSGLSLVVSSGNLPGDLLGVAAGDAGEQGPVTVLLDADADALAARPSHPPAAEGTGGDALAYVLYTSGSTGRPKGVQIPHRAVLSFLASMARAPGLDSDDVLLSVTTLSFDIAGLEVFLPLTQGARVVVAERETALDGRLLAAALDACGATVMQATPATWQQLLASGWSGHPELKALCGGEALPVDLARSLTDRCGELWNVYGPTETTIWSTARRVKRGEESLRGEGVVSLGLPIANTTAHVIGANTDGLPAPIGGPGELWIGGVGLSRGYLGRPGMTAERFVPDPFGDVPGGRLYRTGDLVRRRPEGDLEFLGRLDHQVKVRGFRIELGEVEAALGRHPGVAQGASVVATDGGGASRLIGYVVPSDPSRPPGPDELSSFLSGELPGYMVPTGFMVLEALPLTPNGKVDRGALPEFDGGAVGDGDWVEPRNDLERRLAALWCEVLGVESVSVHSSFFSLGGHSLMATRLLARVQDQEGLELPLGMIFQAPTVALMAAAIEGRRGRFRSNGDPGSGLTVDGEDLSPGGKTTWPMSFGQERLWFLSQLAPEASVAYHQHFAARLSGPLDPEALRRALQGVVERHDVLRTGLGLEHGRPVQRVAAEVAVELPVLPLPEGAPGGDESLDDLVGGMVSEPFDLETPPLFRACLVRESAEAHVLVFVVHHAVFDAGSTGVLFAELAALYGGEDQTPPPQSAAMAPLPLQFGDVAAWHRGRLESGDLGPSFDHWRLQLGDGAPVLELPYDRPRPAVQTFAGDRRTFELSAAATDGLRRLARELGGTLFVPLLAAFQTLLWRIGGQRDISVGTPVANRDRVEMERLIGFFVNTVVLRCRIDPAAAFRGLAEDVRGVVADAFAHRDVPFESLVDDLKPDRSAGYNPLFQAMFLFDGPERSPAKLGPCEVEFLPRRTRTSHFDLTLSVQDPGAGGPVQGFADFNTDLFDGATVERFLDGFRALVDGIVADPEVPLAELSALGPAERRLLLHRWNDTASTVEAGCLHGWVLRQASRTPDAPAVVDDGGTWTYGELEERSRRLAAHLHGLGVRPGSPVALGLPAGRDAVAAILGIHRAGGAYVPLNPGAPPERIRGLLGIVGDPVLITGTAGAVPSGYGGAVVELPGGWGHLPDLPAPPVASDPEHTAYIIFTSGSTGEPKGVVVAHRTAVNLTHAFIEAHGVRAGQRWLVVPPLHFDASVGDLFPALASGGCLVFHPDPGALNGEALEAFCGEQRISVIDTAVALWKQWLDDWLALGRTSVLPDLEIMMVGGEALDTARLAPWARLTGGRVRFFNHYGPTETTVCAALFETRDGGDVERTALPIGGPVANVRVYVVDGDLRPVPMGVAGELVIGGGGVTRGYLGDPAKTAGAFVPDPFAGDGDLGARLYRTGDLVRWLPSGALEFLGRRDRQVKIRGFRIELGEIEALLQSHGAVRESLVLAREGDAGQKRLVAYVRRDPGASVDGDGLRRHLAERLPGFMVPGAVVVLDSFPLTANGKVDLKALPAPSEVEGEVPRVDPRTPLEAEVLGVWCRVLGTDRIGVFDEFFDVGGNSLLAMKLTTAVSQSLDVEVPVARLFEASTVAEYSRLVEDLRAGTTVDLDLASRAVLDPTIQPRPGAPVGTGILVTGGTGFLGAYLLDTLLRVESADLYVLVRAADLDAARRRLREALEGYGLWRPEAADRLVPVLADLSEPRLGMDAEAFDDLAGRIGGIYHNAAWVSFVQPYSKLEPVNVRGTEEVLRLACTAAACPVHFVSTLSVFLTESFLDGEVGEGAEPKPGELHNGYEQSKWVAEELVKQARDRGLPVNIFRPARVTGARRTGAANTEDLFHSLVKGCLQLGLAPNVPDPIDMLPVDFLAEAIVHLARTEAGAGRAFHFYNDHTLPWNRLMEELIARGQSVELVPYGRWYEALAAAVEAGEPNALRSFLALFSDQAQADRQPTFHQEDTQKRLAAADLVCPPADGALIKTYLDFWRRSGFLDP